MKTQGEGFGVWMPLYKGVFGSMKIKCKGFGVWMPSHPPSVARKFLKPARKFLKPVNLAFFSLSVARKLLKPKNLVFSPQNS